MLAQNSQKVDVNKAQNYIFSYSKSMSNIELKTILKYIEIKIKILYKRNDIIRFFFNDKYMRRTNPIFTVCVHYKFHITFDISLYKYLI